MKIGVKTGEICKVCGGQIVNHMEIDGRDSRLEFLGIVGVIKAKCCPNCGKPMKYLAQIQWDTILDGMEDNAYIEICTDCKIIAVLHQQT